jgi:hypothetical protein
MPSKPYWKDSKFWICPKHLPSVSIPGHIKKCWYAGCTSVRPEKELDPFANFNIASVTGDPAFTKGSQKSSQKKSSSSNTKKTGAKNTKKFTTKSDVAQASKDPPKETKKYKKSVVKTKESKTLTTERNPTLCAWFKCDKDNGKPAKARNQSKYCSRDCSNRNARFRMKQRKKQDPK